MSVPYKIDITGISDDFLTPEANRLIEAAEQLVPNLIARAHDT
ncbi:MAG: 3-hydroxy-9,10-secoandrosta-1,3,5(10)-triene-9,17-dione monooxygenase, partial [Colwellia sp.]